MNRLLCTLLALRACSTTGMDSADTGVRSQEVSVPYPIPVRLQEPVLIDDTVAQIEQVLAEAKRLTPAERTRVAGAVAGLSVSCPYTRLSIQLTLALHQEVMKENSCLGPGLGDDWAKLQRGLTAHVELLDLLGASLPAPVMGDHLFGAGFGVIVDRKTLAASDDPFALSLPLQNAVSRLIDTFDDEAYDRMGRDRATGQAILGRKLKFDNELRGWTSALQQLDTSTMGPHAKARLERMLEVLETFAEQGC